MMKTEFKFRYDYYKLQNEAFTTIRGKSAAKQYELNQIVKIVLTDPLSGSVKPLFDVEIVNIEVRRLVDIPLGIMIADAESKLLKIRNKMDFLGLLNSFCRWEKSKLKSLEDEVTIFSLWRY